jgi:hypothetical protein
LAKEVHIIPFLIVLMAISGRGGTVLGGCAAILRSLCDVRFRFQECFCLFQVPRDLFVAPHIVNPVFSHCDTQVQFSRFPGDSIFGGFHYTSGGTSRISSSGVCSPQSQHNAVQVGRRRRLSDCRVLVIYSITR